MAIVTIMVDSSWKDQGANASLVSPTMIYGWKHPTFATFGFSSILKSTAGAGTKVDEKVGATVTDKR